MQRNREQKVDRILIFHEIYIMKMIIIFSRRCQILIFLKFLIVDNMRFFREQFLASN